MTNSKKKYDNRGAENQKDKIFHQLKADETFDPVSILKYGDDTKKLTRAAKSLVGNMIQELYGQDIASLEKKYCKKKQNVNYQLAMIDEIEFGSPSILVNNISRNFD